MRRSREPREDLIRVLRSAFSGELAAGFAYRGHWRSLRSQSEREHVRIIEDEEWHHRELVRGLLEQLGASPSPAREAIFWLIGKAIGVFCHIGGWFLPMYGAGRLERSNIVEYEEGARFAAASGHEGMVDCLLTMAEVEWEHEYFFRKKIEGHTMLRLFPLWNPPPPKESIREAYAVAPPPAATGRR